MSGTPTMWQDAVFEELKAAEVRQVAYVPDGGHARLIERVRSDPSMRAVGLTTEEEGIALSAGSWLGGDRCALLMQSSGLGNCVNMLSLIKVCRFPLLMLITMRGEWGEFNPWQVPMGEATPGLLDLAGVSAVRADAPDEVVETVRQAAIMAFDGGSAVAVLMAQKLIGAKVFVTGGTAI